MVPNGSPGSGTAAPSMDKHRTEQNEHADVFEQAIEKKENCICSGEDPAAVVNVSIRALRGPAWHAAV